MIEKRCADCAFSTPAKNLKLAGVVVECKISPPTRGSKGRGEWPLVVLDDFCFAFVAKSERPKR